MPCSYILSEDLDDSSGVVYRASNYPFNDTTNSLSGYVCLNNGFTVIPQASSSSILNYNGCMPISGVIDLRETSTLNLLGDIEFDASVTLSTGGHIYGNGNSIILNGNLSIPAQKVIHICSGGNGVIGPSGGATIRGNGNIIFIDHWAQIFVDMNTTLTISNARIKFSPRHAPGYPPIRLATPSSKLALDNVTIDMSDGCDFHIITGQLFIHNDVTVTGTSALVYRSFTPSIVTANGCLYFDNGTTFSLAPGTFTSLPISSSSVDQEFIKMMDSTSSIFFNNCSLMTTHTGCKLTTGNVYFDNNVSIDTNTTSSIYNASLNTIETTFRSDDYSYGVMVHPNSRHILVHRATEATIATSLYYYSGISLTRTTYTTLGADFTWSNDGQYCLIFNGTTIYIFRFANGTITLEKTLSSSLGYGVLSPDDKFFARTTGSALQVYKFYGNSFGPMVTSVATTANSPMWSPDGRFIACKTTTQVYIYPFNGRSFGTTIGPSTAVSTTIYPYSWSPDSRAIAVGPLTNYTRIHSFNGSAFTGYSDTTDRTASVRGNIWSPDSKYLCVSGYNPETGIFIYQVNGSKTFANGGRHIARSKELCANSTVSVSWSPDGSFVAGSCGIPSEIVVVPLIFTKDIIPQALSNSLVFGDSTKGSAYDSTINILPQAKIDLKGKMFIDNVEE
jgi:hypothetical protein